MNIKFFAEFVHIILINWIIVSITLSVPDIGNITAKQIIEEN